AAAGSEAEAARLEGRERAGAGPQVGRAEAHDPLVRESELCVGGKPVVRVDPVENVVEGLELAGPFGGRPCAAVEVADRMRGDLVATGVERVEILDAAA